MALPTPSGRKSGGAIGGKPAIFFYLDPAWQAGYNFRTITEAFQKATSNKRLQKSLTPIIEWYVNHFNKAIPSAVSQTMYEKSGKLAKSQVFLSTSTEAGWILKVKSTNLGARVQELGREIKLRPITLQSRKNYWVPLTSFFGNNPLRAKEAISKYGTQMFLHKKVFYSGGASYRIAALKVPYAAQAMKAARASKDPSARTRALSVPMFAVYAGKHTGVRGYSRSRLAKNEESPGRWFSKAIEETTPDFLSYVATRGPAFIRKIPLLA